MLIKDFQIFLNIFPNNCVFRPNARKFNAWFWIFLQNKRKYSVFCNFPEEFFCKFSKILRRPGGSAPGPPTRPYPLPWTARNFFLRTPLSEIGRNVSKKLQSSTGALISIGSFSPSFLLLNDAIANWAAWITMTGSFKFLLGFLTIGRPILAMSSKGAARSSSASCVLAGDLNSSSWRAFVMQSTSSFAIVPSLAVNTSNKLNPISASWFSSPQISVSSSFLFAAIHFSSSTIYSGWL